MILGIGTDIVAVDRFIQWKAYSIQRLSRIFSLDEIAQCGGLQSLNHEKMAARFAAKEAFYKAIYVAFLHWNLDTQNLSLMMLCRYVSVGIRLGGAPCMVVEHDAFERACGVTIPPFYAHVSLSHEKTMAIAVVVLESV